MVSNTEAYIIFLSVTSYITICCASCSADMAREYYRSFSKVDFTLADAQKTDVIYKYFKDTSDKTGKILTYDNVAAEHLNDSLPTVLFIHGWTTDDTSPWFRPLRDEFFKLGDHNIFFVNWSKAGNKSYRVSSANVKPIGKFIATFLIASGIKQEHIHLIGHSLGSHLASFIGKSMFELSGKKVGRITALDPAGPKFENVKMKRSEKLCDSDADFVDVIHTDIQLFGFTGPIGHVDFYPNEGKHQPGCPPRENDDNCSHARSTLYFIESVAKRVTAKEADFTEVNFKVSISVKRNSKQVIFGQHVDKSTRGIYMLSTHSEKPFLIGH